mgnify:FL=1
MAFENIEQLMPDTTETRLAFEEAQRTVADCADAAWRDISSGDVLTASISTVQEAADDAGKHASQHSTLQAKLSAMAQGTELILAAGSYLELPTLEKTHMSVFNRILNYWPKTKKQR